MCARVYFVAAAVVVAAAVAAVVVAIANDIIGAVDVVILLFLRLCNIIIRICVCVIIYACVKIALKPDYHMCGVCASSARNASSARVAISFE